MLEKCKTAQERWGGVSEIIDTWLTERQQLISHFVNLPQTSVNELTSPTQTFCQILMDYLSSGHFEVYEQLLKEGDEFNDGSLEKAQDLFPKIQASTDEALDFNDSFGNFSGETLKDMQELADRLSHLGESLEERFSLEDQMIEILHIAHKDQVYDTSTT